MTDKQLPAQYKRELKMEAVRQVRAGQAQSVVAKVLGIPKASLGRWMRLSDKGELAAGVADYSLSSWDSSAGSMSASKGLIAILMQYSKAMGLASVLPVSKVSAPRPPLRLLPQLGIPMSSRMDARIPSERMSSVSPQAALANICI